MLAAAGLPAVSPGSAAARAGPVFHATRAAREEPGYACPSLLSDRDCLVSAYSAESRPSAGGSVDFPHFRSALWLGGPEAQSDSPSCGAGRSSWDGWTKPRSGSDCTTIG